MGHLSNEHMDSFRQAMAEAGVRYVGDLEADGTFRRIHVEGDRKGDRNGWYVLHSDGIVPAGAFGTNKGDQRYKWKATEGLKQLTQEERAKAREEAARKKAEREAVERAAQAEAAVRAQVMWEQAADATDHPYLARKGVPGYGLRVGVWVKESPPDPHTGEITELRIPGALLIPIRDERKTIVGLQAIFSPPAKIFGSERDKDFIRGARKSGCWATIGKPTEVDGALTVVIVEGYATGASVHRATGLGVVVAFDCGNLAPVAATVRRLMPKARILIAADNDAWTANQHKTAPWNPGVEKATAAAKAVDGLWVAPLFEGVPSWEEGRALAESDRRALPTDFNDLDKRAGLDEVRRQIMAVVSPAPPEPPAPEPEPEPEPPPPPPFEEEPAMPGDPLDEPMPSFGSEEDTVDSGQFFTIRGHDREHIFVFQHEGQMIVDRGFSDWSEAALTAIAPLQWWEAEFPGEKGMNRKMAINWLQRTAYKRGFFDPSRCRGRGAWLDEGRIVYHCGDILIVDGVRMPIAMLRSNYVYEQGHKLRPPADDPMAAADGKRLVEIAQMFSWTRPASALLLAGWVALAPLCGALRWRPHIWVTGGAGSGKTTILNEFVWPLMGGTEVYAQGNSTEAGIRQTLRTDASPVLFDESEQNNEREEHRIQGVLALVRQSSTESGARTLKGSASGLAMGFLTRSMFCLSSIQVGIKQQADLERLTVLALRSKKKDELSGVQASENWKRLSGALSEMRRDQELPSRLLKRSLQLLPTTLLNIEVFAQAAAEKFGSQREGDQFGAMLAGAWSLVSTKLATLEDARAMIDRYDWSEYTEDAETEESAKALSALLGSKVRVKNGIEVTVYEVVAAAAGKPLDSFDPGVRDADAYLRRHGMAIKWTDRYAENAALLVSNNSNELKRLLEGTPYVADIKGQLGRVPGAFKEGMTSFHGTKSRAVGIPLTEVLDGLRAREPGAFEVDDNIPF